MQEFTTFVLLEDLSPFPILYRCSKNVTIDYKYISGCAHTRGKVVRCCHHDGVANWLVKPLSRKEGKLCNCRVCSCFTLQPHTFFEITFYLLQFFSEETWYDQQEDQDKYKYKDKTCRCVKVLFCAC